jgi:hypothetical protein
MIMTDYGLEMLSNIVNSKVKSRILPVYHVCPRCNSVYKLCWTVTQTKISEQEFSYFIKNHKNSSGR